MLAFYAPEPCVHIRDAPDFIAGWYGWGLIHEKSEEG